MSIVATVAQVLAAAGACAAAWYARQSAESSARAAQAQLFTQLADAYDTPEMAQALRSLRRWREDRATDFAIAVEDWATDQVSDRPSEATLARDTQRRLVSHFFGKAALTVEEHMLAGNTRDFVASLYGREVMRDVVLPMDRALHRRQGSPTADAFEMEKRFLRAFFPSRR